MKNDCYLDIADEIFDETKKQDFIIYKKRKTKDIEIIETEILDDDNPFHKEKGIYSSFNFVSLENEETFERLKRLLIKYLKSFIFDLTKKNKPHILFVGLGNENYAPDSLGPKVVKNINSNYIFKQEVGCLVPGVTGLTGMETSNIIKGVLSLHDYDLVFLIDSLSTISVDRLNKTIQITDNGIVPGSGIDNKRKAINEKTLNTKVLTLGVATIISYQNVIEEFLKDNNLNCKYQNKNLIFTSKEVENSIEYLSLLLSEVINSLF